MKLSHREIAAHSYRIGHIKAVSSISRAKVIAISIGVYERYHLAHRGHNSGT